MCGRYVSSTTADRVAEFFGAAFDADPLAPSHNVAPTNEVYGVVGAPGDVRRLEVFHWGLVPVWAKDTKIASKMINARSETVAEKPAFKRLFAASRCIVPMDGFYEWKKLDASPKPAKQPMFIHRADGDPLAVAGLWTAWKDKALGPDAPWLHTLTVLTTAANGTMAPVHDRMPVILDRADWATWLDPQNRDVDSLALMLRAAADDVLTMHPVSTAVNAVRNKGPELTAPVDPA